MMNNIIINETKLKLLPNNDENNKYVFSEVGNRLFKITKELDNELIEKSIKKTR